MIKILLRIVLPFVAAALIIGASQSAHAGFYFGVGHTNLDVDFEDAPALKPSMVNFRVGHTLVGGFAIEGRFASDSSTETATVEGITGDFEVETLAGLYGVGRLRLTPRLALYGIAGASYARAKATDSNINVTGDAAGFSWGAGGELAITPRIHGFVETMKHFDQSDYTSEGLTLGVLVRL